MSIEQRTENRVSRAIGIFAHIHHSDESPDYIGKSIHCEGADFSAQGMRFSSDLLLEPGTVLYLSVAIESPFSIYLLAGTVRWADNLDGEQVMGIRLEEKEGSSELERWIDDFDINFPVIID